MSINSMANAAIGRNPDFPPLESTPQTFGQIAQAAGTNPPEDNGIGTALQIITTYIPTEVLTLYVAVIAALRPVTAGSSLSLMSHWIAFAVFLVFVPAAVWVVFATKVSGRHLPLPLNLRQWPKWEMIAGTLAYVTWAIGLPDTPFAMFSWYSSAIGGVIVLVGATLLGMVAPLFQRQLPSTQPRQPVPATAGAMPPTASDHSTHS